MPRKLNTVSMTSLSFLKLVGSLTRYDVIFISDQVPLLSWAAGDIVDEAREEVVGKEASSQDKSVVCGISTGQREEACEALLLSASIEDWSRGDTGNCTNWAGELAARGLAVALAIDVLTV